MARRQQKYFMLLPGTNEAEHIRSYQLVLQKAGFDCQLINGIRVDIVGRGSPSAKRNRGAHDVQTRMGIQASCDGGRKKSRAASGIIITAAQTCTRAGQPNFQHMAKAGVFLDNMSVPHAELAAAHYAVRLAAAVAENRLSLDPALGLVGSLRENEATSECLRCSCELKVNEPWLEG